MTAAAYPVVVANGISQCIRKVPILKMDQSPSCDALAWDEVDFSSVALSCGPAQVHSDRCCDLILGIGGQVHSIYANQTGHAMPQVNTTRLQKSRLHSLHLSAPRVTLPRVEFKLCTCSELFVGAD
jgi:hypothetical protein